MQGTLRFGEKMFADTLADSVITPDEAWRASQVTVRGILDSVKSCFARKASF